MTTLQGPAQRLTVSVGESDTVGDRPLHTEIAVDVLVLLEDVQVVHHAGRAAG